MVLFNISDLLRSLWRKTPERISIGDVVSFHDGSYAKVIPLEEYEKLSGRPKPSESVIRKVKRREWYCLRTNSGAYFLLPSSVFDEENHYN